MSFVIMRTRGDDILARAEILYFIHHPLEIFCEIPWDGLHWKQVVSLAKQEQWVELKFLHRTYMQRYG